MEYSQRIGLLSISIEWPDPEVAVDWTNKTIQHANAYLLDKDEKEALPKLRYYEKQVEQESTVNIRSDVYQLIQNEYERLATLKARVQHVLKAIDPAFIPNRKFHRQRRVIVTMGIILGFLASIGYVVLRDEFDRSVSDED